MNKRIVIYDTEQNSMKQCTQKNRDETIYFHATPQLKHCIGCFGCWIKTPGKCVIKDRGKDLPRLWASSNHIIIVSQLVYGGFSPSIKACMDRSLGYILPYFRIVDGEMHHQLRYNNKFNMTVYFYSDTVTKIEKETAIQLVNANKINFGADYSDVYFYKNAEEIREVLL